MDDVTALALAARDGDRVALSDFIRRTWAEVGRLAADLAGPALAEDVAQDTYVRALRALPAYRADSAARTWLLSIARRAAVDAVRGAARRRRLSGLLAGGAGAGDAAHVPLADGVLTHQVLSRLDLDRRTAFVLTQLMGFDYASTAEVCGCPVGTIRSRVARARTQLVAEMGLVDVGRSEPVAEPDEPPVLP
ncbi:MAG TPA: sigma factor-like helix-turn-helix DNA-binding protein [Acidimicrobiales bacterium]|nr:sigma factor-like helix-turn-helix DNA-binding protein [Acidimicrobiales bacterium]